MPGDLMYQRNSKLIDARFPLISEASAAAEGALVLPPGPVTDWREVRCALWTYEQLEFLNRNALEKRV